MLSPADRRRGCATCWLTATSASVWTPC